MVQKEKGSMVKCLLGKKRKQFSSGQLLIMLELEYGAPHHLTS